MLDSKNFQEENLKTSNTQGGVPCLCPGRQKWVQAYKMHPRSLMIRDDIPYVDAFSDTWTQFNGERAIDMGLLNIVRTSSSYSQLGRVVLFLQNFPTWSIVILTSLPIGVAKVVIDILFACAMACQSAISRKFKNMSRLNARAPGVLPNVVAIVTGMACIAAPKPD